MAVRSRESTVDSIIRRSSGVIAVGRGRWGEALPWSGGGVVDFGGVGEVGGGVDETSGGDVNDVEVVSRCGKKANGCGWCGTGGAASG